MGIKGDRVCSAAPGIVVGRLVWMSVWLEIAALIAVIQDHGEWPDGNDLRHVVRLPGSHDFKLDQPQVLSLVGDALGKERMA